MFSLHELRCRANGIQSPGRAERRGAGGADRGERGLGWSRITGGLGGPAPPPARGGVGRAEGKKGKHEQGTGGRGGGGREAAPRRVGGAHAGEGSWARGMPLTGPAAEMLRTSGPYPPRRSRHGPGGRQAATRHYAASTCLAC